MCGRQNHTCRITCCYYQSLRFREAIVTRYLSRITGVTFLAYEFVVGKRALLRYVEAEALKEKARGGLEGKQVISGKVMRDHPSFATSAFVSFLMVIALFTLGSWDHL